MIRIYHRQLQEPYGGHLVQVNLRRNCKRICLEERRRTLRIWIQLEIRSSIDKLVGSLFSFVQQVVKYTRHWLQQVTV